MNPFLSSTVASPVRASWSKAAPLPDMAASAVAPPARAGGSGPRPARVLAPPARVSPARTRWSRTLRLAGLAALAWAGAAGAVDLNTATLDQLRGVRGIGPKTAQIILQERERGGRYLSFADLSDRVRGIGPKRARTLQSSGLTIDGGGQRVSGQGAAARQAAPPAVSSGVAVPRAAASGGPGQPPAAGRGRIR